MQLFFQNFPYTIGRENHIKLHKTHQIYTTNIKNDYHINDQVSTREASQNIMNQLVKDNPQFWGGAADLSSSNKTYLTNQGDYKSYSKW